MAVPLTGTGTPGAITGADIGTRSHPAQRRNLSLEQKLVDSGGLLSPSVLLGAGSGS